MKQSVVGTKYKGEVYSGSDKRGMTYLVAVGASQLVLWEKGKDPIELERGASVWSVAFSPDSTYLVSGDGSYNVKVWRVATKQLHHLFKHTNYVNALVFSPDGNIVAGGSTSNSYNLKLWDLARQQEVKNLTGHSSGVWGLSYSSYGKYLVSGGRDQKIKVWKTDSMTEYRSYDEPTWSSDNARYCPVRFIPNTKLFVSGGHDGSIKVWDIDTNHYLNCFTGHNSCVHSIDVSPCEKYIVAGDRNNKVVLYNISGHLYTYEGHTNTINCAAFSPCGKFIISGGWNDNLILTWVNWKKLYDDGLLQVDRDWASKQYVRVNHDGASIEGKAARSLQG